MEMGKKRIAALTMLRNDEVFLRKWVDYYGAQLGRENLYVWFDGLDQRVPDFCDGVNVEVVAHIEGNVREGDRGRIAFLSAKAAELFFRYDLVIGTDVDEFLVVDPALGVGLADFLSSLAVSGRASFSGLGVDVGSALVRRPLPTGTFRSWGRGRMPAFRQGTARPVSLPVQSAGEAASIGSGAGTSTLSKTCISFISDAWILRESSPGCRIPTGLPRDGRDIWPRERRLSLT